MRGRPSRIPKEFRAVLRSLYPEIKTGRGQLNKYYELRAMKVLENVPEAKEIYDKEKCVAGDASGWKLGILRELGKMDNNEELRMAALEICKDGMDDGDAILFLKRLRGTTAAKAHSSVDLANKVIATLNDYRKSFPNMTKAEVEEALHLAVESVGKSES